MIHHKETPLSSTSTSSGHHSTVWADLSGAQGVLLSRDEYRGALKELRKVECAWMDKRVDTLSIRPRHDAATDAWAAGRRDAALALVDQELQGAGAVNPNLRRLVIVPAELDDYAQFALAAVRRLAAAGAQVRVLPDRGDRIPELYLRDQTIFLLRADADHIASGALRLDDPVRARRVRAELDELWDRAGDPPC